MSALSIVEDFDVTEQAGFGLFLSQMVFPMHLLFFEGGEEAFDYRVVPIRQRYPPLRLMLHTMPNF